MPKVLHLLLDGYNPTNIAKIFDEDKLNEYMRNKVYGTVDLHTHVTRGIHLKSPRMWFRYYSRRYVEKDESMGRARITSLYDEVDGAELIWRKLAHQNVPSFVMPYNAMTGKTTEWLVGDKSDDATRLINGIFKNWYSDVCYPLTNGKFDKVKTKYIMSALMTTVSNDCKIYDEDLLKKLDYLKSSESDEIYGQRFYEVLPDIEDKFLSLVDEKLKGNLDEWEQRVIPNLTKFAEQYDGVEDQYVHLGFGETDAMYHFILYKKAREEILYPYLWSCITKAVEAYNPDVVIISGDHNMLELKYTREYEGALTSERTRYAEVNLGDMTMGISKAFFAPLPIFTDHGYTVGSRCYFNAKGKQFVLKLKSMCDANTSERDDHDELFPEHLYDCLLDLHNDESVLDRAPKLESKRKSRKSDNNNSDSVNLGLGDDYEYTGSSRIGVVVPTVFGANGFWKVALFNRLLPSLVHIKKINNLHFLINAQCYPEQIQEELRSRINEAILPLNPTWKVTLKFRDGYEKPVKMVHVRNDCMMMDTDVDYYVFIDDKTKFNQGAGANYADIIKFFDADKDLGTVMSAGFLGGYNYVGKLKYAVQKLWMTNRGLFLRNVRQTLDDATVPDELKSPVYSREAMEVCYAGCEDAIAVADILRHGYKTATYFNNPTDSKATNMEDDSKSNPRYEEDTIHNGNYTFDSYTKYAKLAYGYPGTVKSLNDIKKVQQFIYDKYGYTWCSGTKDEGGESC